MKNEKKDENEPMTTSTLGNLWMKCDFCLEMNLEWNQFGTSISLFLNAFGYFRPKLKLRQSTS